jgi:HlyD family secretion protein
VRLLLVTLAIGYRSYRLAPVGPRDDEQPAASPEGRTPGSPSSSQGTASSGEVALVSKGYVIPAHQIQVSPNKVNGILKYVHPRLEEGQVFQAGEVLARIETLDFQARRDHAFRALAEARRRLDELKNVWPVEIAQSKARLDSARTRLDLSRIKRDITLRADQNVAKVDREEAVKQAEMDDRNYLDAQSALEMIQVARKEQIAQAEHRIDQFQADLDEAEWLLKNCEIKAPITGTILKKNAEEGNYVNPGALSGGSGGISVSLCEMANLADLEIDLSVQERDISSVQVGQACTVMPEAYQSYKPFTDKYPTGYPAKVSRIMPIADRGKGAISVRVKPDVPESEAGKYLKPEMGVIVKFKKVD